MTVLGKLGVALIVLGIMLIIMAALEHRVLTRMHAFEIMLVGLLYGWGSSCFITGIVLFLQ